MKSQQRQNSLASWYMQGPSDRVGDRLFMYDNTGGPSLELLRFRPQLAESPGFERALRARVDRLNAFTHRAFPAIQAVQHLEDGEGLAVVSTFAPGKRLSEILNGPRVSALQPAFATSLIRQLTPALAELQRQGPDITHGLVSANRVVLTPDGTLVLREHVLGAAFEALRLKSAELWADFGVIVPPDENGMARFDRRTDVVQVGLLALSVLLGRLVTPVEYPSRLGLLLDEFSEGFARRYQSGVAPLYFWLDRALRTSPQMFTCAEDALEELKELPHHAAPTPIEHTAPVLRGLPSATLPTEAQESGEERRSLQVPSFGQSRVERAPFASFSEENAREEFDAETASTGSKRSASIAWSVAAALALVTVVEGVVIARSAGPKKPAAPPVAAAVPLTIESPQAGDMVLVDGQQAGVTPLRLSVGSNAHSILIVNQTVEKAVAAAAAEPETTDPKAEAALAQAAARQRSGGVRISSPVELKVLEGEHVLGSSADGPIVTTAGVHQLDFINTVIGFRSHQTVTIKPGQIASMKVAPPDGRLNINASPWAQVFIDGSAAGETPLANISIPAGEHEITFRHPQLGERRESILVKAGATVRVSATLTR